MLISSLLIYILPEVGVMRPFIIFSVVVFPQPLSPIIATNLPFSISKETSERTVVFLNFFEIFSNFINVNPPL